MHYDVVIIGAGLSGLAAGIRLAHFDRQVCIFEKHYAYGGLNSYYTRDRREFDVGLHAVTNYVPPGVRNTPLPKLLRQLRLTREDFDLCEQRFSEIRFPDHRLRFTNDINDLVDEVARQFPGEVDRFRRLLDHLTAYDDTRLEDSNQSARGVLSDFLHDPALVEMLLCPMMYYGSAQEHDMDFRSFVTLFKSILLEGFARPRGGTRTILKTLVRRFRACGGELRMRCGVERINTALHRVTSLTLQTGETVTADVVLSSAGLHETERLCHPVAEGEPLDEPGRLSFCEFIILLDEPPALHGLDSAILFFNDSNRFTYAQPDELVDRRSGVICCPNNFDRHDDMAEGVFRLTLLANCDRWMALRGEAYAAAKRSCLAHALRSAEQHAPGLTSRVVATDMFTPRTIQRFTGHINGAVYGTPHKRRDGGTRLKNLFLCGTDQGFLGIIGAMLSGVTIANLQVLSKT